MQRKIAIAALLIAGTSILNLTGCTKNPATGKTTFTGGLNKSQETKLGAAHHSKIMAEFGGEYKNKNLLKYVNSIGTLIASTSERPNLNWKFTILNSEVVNAFATPGGYVYITRGLLALADNEAQLASVLAHEIGHITALHHAKRHGQSLMANVGIVAASVFGGRNLGRLSQFGTTTLLKSFSRENEYEADALSIRYLGRAGYQTQATANFLVKLRENSILTAKQRGEKPGKINQFSYLSTHPTPNNRIKKATALSRSKNIRNPIIAKNIYLSKIDGLIYGNDPKAGVVRGRDFLHPTLGFSFRVPEGFSIFNSPQAVKAFGPKGAQIIFDRAIKGYQGPIKNYIRFKWAKNHSIRDLESLQINGMNAATAATNVKKDGQIFPVRLVAYRFNKETIYRFLFITSSLEKNNFSMEYRRTTYSFCKLSSSQASNLKPLILKIIEVKKRDTLETLSLRLPYTDFKLERLALLNGLSVNTKLLPGQKLKTIVAQ